MLYDLTAQPTSWTRLKAKAWSWPSSDWCSASWQCWWSLPTPCLSAKTLRQTSKVDICMMKNEAASVYTYVSYVTLLWWSWMMALRGAHIRDLILPFIACFSEYMKIIAIFYYPVLFYPLLACSTLQHKAGYVFGTLLSFGHFGILLWQKFDCPKTPEVRRQWHFSILRWERGPSLCARVAALWDFQGIKVLVCWSFKGWITSTFLLTDL